MRVLGMTLVPDAEREPDPAPLPVALDDPEIGRLPWAIAAAMRRTPWESRCLAQALAGATMLRLRRVPSLVYFGVRPAKSSAGREMSAHAWLVSDGRILTGAGEHESHAVVAVYSTLVPRSATERP